MLNVEPLDPGASGPVSCCEAWRLSVEPTAGDHGLLCKVRKGNTDTSGTSTSNLFLCKVQLACGQNLDWRKTAVPRPAPALLSELHGH